MSTRNHNNSASVCSTYRYRINLVPVPGSVYQCMYCRRRRLLDSLVPGLLVQFYVCNYSMIFIMLCTEIGEPRWSWKTRLAHHFLDCMGLNPIMSHNEQHSQFCTCFHDGSSLQEGSVLLIFEYHSGRITFSLFVPTKQAFCTLCSLLPFAS
jgi:hypothetical protein